MLVLGRKGSWEHSHQDFVWFGPACKTGLTLIFMGPFFPCVRVQLHINCNISFLFILLWHTLMGMGA